MDYITVSKEGFGEYEEKKSRFLAFVFPAESEEEVLARIEAHKKKYWDARHNCYAYILGEDGALMRFSDDGEPGGTAGRPMLDVLAGRKLTNVCVIVTRYFGGVLLGTGGLVRAYSQASANAVADAAPVKKVSVDFMELALEYTELGKVQYLLAREELTPTDIRYESDVKVCVGLPKDRADAVLKALTNAVNGKIRYEKIGEGYADAPV